MWFRDFAGALDSTFWSILWSICHLALLEWQLYFLSVLLLIALFVLLRSQWRLIKWP